MTQPSATVTCAQDASDDELHQRAACLINPYSGIANDFLNHFNEIFLLVENLPMLLPEMVDELIEWKPLTYSEYFNRSRLPGSAFALQRYAAMEPEARAYFDDHVTQLNAKAVEIVETISKHRLPDGTIPPEKVADFCEVASAAFVNCGYSAVRQNKPHADALISG